jgi:hypothetical protein
VAPLNELYRYRSLFDDLETDGDIVRLSEKCFWLIYEISGSLKINKLQAIENQKDRIWDFSTVAAIIDSLDL